MNNSIKYLLFIIILLTHCNLFAQVYGLQIKNNRNQTTIPFKTFNNLIIIPVSINGSDTLNFIVDTGVRYTILLNKAIADNLNMEYARKIDILGASSDQIIVGHIVNKVSFETKGLFGNINSLLVIEDDYIRIQNYFGRNIHGIIGHDLFKRFVIKINYNKKTLVLSKPENFKVPWLYTKFDIELENGKPYLHSNLTIDDTTIINSYLLIDLGASHAAMLDLGKLKTIVRPTNYLESNLGRGLGGKIEGYKARINELEIGKFSFSDVIISFAKPHYYSDSIFKIDRNGTIGGEIMSRFHVIFNYLDNSMYLKKNRDYRAKFEIDLSGINLMVVKMGFNAYLVDEIIKDSAADLAGIKVGDYIKKINHIPSFEMSYDEIIEIFHSRPNRLIKIVLNRNGKDIKTKFRLKRQI